MRIQPRDVVRAGSLLALVCFAHCGDSLPMTMGAGSVSKPLTRFVNGKSYTATPDTLDAVLTQAAPGDLIFLSPGTYTSDDPDEWTPVLALNDNPGITFVADGQVIFDGGGTRKFGVYLRNSPNTVIAGVILQGFTHSCLRYDSDASGTVVDANCLFVDLVARESPQATGFNLRGPLAGIVFEACEASGCVSGFSTTAFPMPDALMSIDPTKNIESLRLYAPSHCTWLRCVAHDNVTVEENSDGFVIARTTDCLLKDCTSYANADDGYDINGTVRTTIVGCSASDNGRGVAGDGIGFKLGVFGGINANVTNCSALNNRGHGYSFTNHHNLTCMDNVSDTGCDGEKCDECFSSTGGQ